MGGGTEVNVWHLPDPTSENSFGSVESGNGMGLDLGKRREELIANGSSVTCSLDVLGACCLPNSRTGSPPPRQHHCYLYKLPYFARPLPYCRFLQLTLFLLPPLEALPWRHCYCMSRQLCLADSLLCYYWESTPSHVTKNIFSLPFIYLWVAAALFSRSGVI